MVLIHLSGWREVTEDCRVRSGVFAASGFRGQTRLFLVREVYFGIRGYVNFTAFIEPRGSADQVVVVDGVSVTLEACGRGD